LKAVEKQGVGGKGIRERKEIKVTVYGRWTSYT
jgi:hypothetical protein